MELLQTQLSDSKQKVDQLESELSVSKQNIHQLESQLIKLKQDNKTLEAQLLSVQVGALEKFTHIRQFLLPMIHNLY